MLCYRCGSHVADGLEACPSCGQRFDTGLRGRTGQYRRRPLDVEAGGIKSGDLLAGRYEIRGPLGSGPIGAVFRALDREIDVEVALKVIHPNLLQSVEERNEFMRSLRQAKRLSHPNLVRVYDVGQVEATADQPARAFFTAQLLDGMTLRKVIELRREKGEFFSAAEAEPIIAQIAQALDHAQQAGAHGDLKPENVMVLPDLLKVIDFGVTPAIPRAPFLAAQRHRKSDIYLAPEVLAGHTFDRRADVYSLGVIFGEMVSGRLPSPTGQVLELRESHPQLPAGVQPLYRRAQSQDPKVRFPTAGDFAGELLTLAESVPVQPPPLPVPAAAPVAPAAVPAVPAAVPAVPAAVIDLPAARHRPPPPPPGALDVTPQDRPATPMPPPVPEVPTLWPPPPKLPGARTGPVGVPPPGDAPTPRMDVTIDPHELKLNPKPRPPSLSPAIEKMARVARPLEESNSSTSTVATAVRHRPRGGSWLMWLAICGLSATAAVVAGGHFFYEWKSTKDDRVIDQQRKQAQQQLDEGLKPPAAADDAGSDAGGPLAAARVNGALVVGADAGERSPGTTGGAGSVGKPVAGPVATANGTTGGEEPAAGAATVHLDSTDGGGKAHRDHVVAPAENAGADQTPRTPSTCPQAMQLIPTGAFRLGTPASDDLGNFGDRAEHKVGVHAFCIDTYEYPNQAGARPEVSVNSSSAEAACKKDGKRLCSEEEWEKACKGPSNRRFPYGDAYDGSACRAKGGVAAAGAASGCRSGYGVFDLSGNAAEWTASRFQAGASDRVVKGGSVESPDYELRCSARSNRAPTVRSERLGFRCCADLK